MSESEDRLTIGGQIGDLRWEAPPMLGDGLAGTDTRAMPLRARVYGAGTTEPGGRAAKAMRGQVKDQQSPKAMRKEMGN